MINMNKTCLICKDPILNNLYKVKRVISIIVASFVISILAMDIDERLRQNRLNEIYTKYIVVLFKTNDLIQNMIFNKDSKQKLNQFNSIKDKLIKYETDMIIFKKNNNIY